HGIVIGTFVLLNILISFGWQNTLYLPGRVPDYTYSDMNGYGHFVPAIAWSIIYWTAIFAFLGVVSIAYARRGAEDSLRARTKLAKLRAPALRLAGGLCLLLAAGSGIWYFYNTHVLNEFMSADDRRRQQADYEKSYKKYELQPLPKVTAVDLAVNIYPERR